MIPCRTSNIKKSLTDATEPLKSLTSSTEKPTIKSNLTEHQKWATSDEFVQQCWPVNQDFEGERVQYNRPTPSRPERNSTGFPAYTCANVNCSLPPPPPPGYIFKAIFSGKNEKTRRGPHSWLGRFFVRLIFIDTMWNFQKTPRRVLCIWVYQDIDALIIDQGLPWHESHKVTLRGDMTFFN